jgi:hypothetical protein
MSGQSSTTSGRLTLKILPYGNARKKAPGMELESNLGCERCERKGKTCTKTGDGGCFRCDKYHAICSLSLENGNIIQAKSV